MSILDKILSKFVGTKAQRDLSEIQPYVDKVKVAYENIINLTNDQLRERSEELKQKIKSTIKPEKDQIEQLAIGPIVAD